MKKSTGAEALLRAPGDGQVMRVELRTLQSVGSLPMWCTAMDTFCTMWKRSPATVMVLPPLTGLRRGLMAVMTGFCMYSKMRLPRAQPRRSKRTHTGTGAARAPLGTVQVMLVSVRTSSVQGSELFTRTWSSEPTWRSLPWMVILVPPALGPLSGSRDWTWGST